MGLLEHTEEEGHHRPAQAAPGMILELVEKVRRVLCNPDPAVMEWWGWLPTSSRPWRASTSNPTRTRSLNQICERRLPSEFDFHRIPALWMQMKIVRILSIIGKNDATSSEDMCEILLDCLRKAEESLRCNCIRVQWRTKYVTQLWNSMLIEMLGWRSAWRNDSGDSTWQSRVKSNRTLVIDCKDLWMLQLLLRHSTWMRKPYQISDEQRDCLDCKDCFYVHSEWQQTQGMHNSINQVYHHGEICVFIQIISHGHGRPRNRVAVKVFYDISLRMFCLLTRYFSGGTLLWLLN